MRGQLLVSTAEGFFLVSGIVLGIVRGAKLVDTKFVDVAKTVLKRALQLYITYVLLVVIFTLIAWYVYPNSPGVKAGVMQMKDFWLMLWNTLGLQYTYGWADYLRFYAIFIFFAPVALWLLRKKLWYVVLAISFGVWHFFTPELRSMPWDMTQILQPIPWQVLFFIGLTIGFHWPDIASFVENHKRRLVRYVATPLIGVAIVLFLINVFAVFAAEFTSAEWAQSLRNMAMALRDGSFDKEELTAPRLLLFLLWFWAWFIIVTWFQKPILKYAGWLLVPFGTNSLYVYTLQSVIVFFIHIYFTSTWLLPNFIIVAGSIALIYFAIKTKFLMNIIPR